MSDSKRRRRSHFSAFDHLPTMIAPDLSEPPKSIEQVVEKVEIIPVEPKKSEPVFTELPPPPKIPPPPVPLKFVEVLASESFRQKTVQVTPWSPPVFKLNLATLIPEKVKVQPIKVRQQKKVQKPRVGLICGALITIIIILIGLALVFSNSPAY